MLSTGLRSLFLIVITGTQLMLSAVYATSSQSIIINEPPEKTREIVLRTLEKTGNRAVPNEKTYGFTARYKDSILSPFNFDVYIGPYENISLVRIDSGYNRMSFALADAIRQENGEGPFPVKYGKKLTPIGDFLTILSPSAGYLYTYSYSPFRPTDFQYWTTPLSYLGIDLVLLWIGGKTFFTHGFDPFDRGIIATSILMGGFRAAHLFRNHLTLSAQNKMVNLGYSFSY